MKDYFTGKKFGGKKLTDINDKVLMVKRSPNSDNKTGASKENEALNQIHAYKRVSGSIGAKIFIQILKT